MRVLFRQAQQEGRQMADYELKLNVNCEADPSEFADAVDRASDQDGITWLVDGPSGRRIGAIVPVDVAEDHQASMAAAAEHAFRRRS
jgi:hypothetical protein